MGGRSVRGDQPYADRGWPDHTEENQTPNETSPAQAALEIRVQAAGRCRGWQSLCLGVYPGTRDAERPVGRRDSPPLSRLRVRWRRLHKDAVGGGQNGLQIQGEASGERWQNLDRSKRRLFVAEVGAGAGGDAADESEPGVEVGQVAKDHRRDALGHW